MKQATLNNEIVTIVATNGGWTTVNLPDGTTKKVRNGALAVVTGEDRDTFATAHQEDTAMDQATVETTETQSTDAVEVKKPTPPVREARPAHFVADVAPGKVAKIKDTTFDLSRYFVSDVKTPTGRRTIDCADDVAARLRGLPVEQVYAEAAEALGVSVASLQEQYGHLNVGMQRMNLGNRIRGAAKAREQAAARAESKARREQEAIERAAKKQAEAEARAAAATAREQARAEARAAKEAAAQAKADAKEAAKQQAEAQSE